MGGAPLPMSPPEASQRWGSGKAEGPAGGHLGPLLLAEACLGRGCHGRLQASVGE